MNDRATGDEAPDAQGGVFGKLPASRPGTRSPRRGGERGATEPAAQAAADEPEAEPPAQRAPEPAAPEPAAEAPASPRPQSRSGSAPDVEDEALEARRAGGIEDLAWAGIAAAAEAATLGVRLASRAMGAVRDSVDRR